MALDLLQRKINGRPTKNPGVAVLAELYETHSAKEIAKMYDVKEKTVRDWLYRCRKQLRAEAEAAAKNNE